MALCKTLGNRYIRTSHTFDLQWHVDQQDQKKYLTLMMQDVSLLESKESQLDQKSRHYKMLLEVAKSQQNRFDRFYDNSMSTILNLKKKLKPSMTPRQLAILNAPLEPFVIAL